MLLPQDTYQLFADTPARTNTEAHTMPKRARDRRRTSSPIDALARTLDRVSGGPCRAVQLRSVDGTPAMLLMGDSCAVCREFRAGIPPRPEPKPHTPDVPSDTEEGWTP